MTSDSHARPSAPNSLLLPVAGFFAALALAALAVLSGAIGLYGCLWLSLFLLSALIAMAFRTFNGGRHPCFLFLAMLLLFQMGRLVGYALSATRDPFDVVVQTLLPLHVSTASSEITLLLILLSATTIYAVCAWYATPVTLHPGPERRWLPAAYTLFAASFPFVLYKDFLYLQFIRSHGGYLAIFTDSAQLTAVAGPIVRIMSLVAANVFILIYVLERRPIRLALVTTLFLSTSVLELAIGLRGKVFLFLITLWFISHLKSGKPFRLAALAAVALAASFAAVALAGFREMRSTAITGPAHFIAGQGISMGVTQIAVQYRPLFAPHARAYIADEIIAAFYPGSHFGQGQLFDNDISVFLNPAAFQQGFGTGSSYLAEAYIAGGLSAVLLVSVIIGLFLRWLHRIGRHWIGAVTLAVLLPTTIYMPRAQLLGPLAEALKSGIIFALMLPILWLIHLLLFDHHPATPPTP